MFARILACVDGTAPGVRACAVAVELAERFHSHLTLFTVNRPRGKTVDPYLESLVPVGAEGKTLQHQLELAGEEAKSHGASSFELVLRRGEVLESVLEYLGHNPQDLVVVGSRGLSRGGRFLLGSVSTSLVNLAPCPVLVVRAIARRRKDAPEPVPHVDHGRRL